MQAHLLSPQPAVTKLVAAAATLCVLGSASAAFAQPAGPARSAGTRLLQQQNPPPAEPQPPAEPTGPAEPAPAPPEQPPPNYPPSPPPNYPPPPPYGPPPYGYYQPGYYPGAPPQRSLYRPFTLGLGLGVGMLSFRDLFGERASEVGLSYTMRVGFGVTTRWLVFLGVEGTGVNHLEAGVWQTAYVLGAQAFLVQHLYMRGGFGLANSTGEDANDSTGYAVSGVAGFEFAQGYSTALGLELSVTAAHYAGATWTNGGLNFVLSFF
ncbi:MAG TPA: hypothetical protein VN914_20370 [Polyangia bacterium]|nr:hypothetical protein [Polyangia bacterium]